MDSVLHYVCGERLEPHDYFRSLARTVLAIARGGNAVFVGRGADLLLPQECGLRVRIIAPKQRCIETYAERHGLDREAAAREIERIVKERDAFIRRYFHRDPADPARYDLMLNLARLTPDDVIELVVEALQRRGVPTAA
ncbi:MAG: cytidylate kinase-like family protein [Planctomycetota bacterium]|nr:MAG: cytidylate kinase-like family protein [Planctomycetota bacterium]